MNNNAINLLHRCVSILRKNDLDVNAEMLKQKDRWVTCSTIGDPGDKKGSFLFAPKLGLLKCINYKRVDGYQTVSLKDEAELSASDRKQLRKIEKIWDGELQEQTEKMHDFTAVHAYSQYREFDVPTASNAYLTKKGMPVLSRMRCEGENLILPILNSVGDIVNYESISPDGEKRTLPGGKTSGCIYPIFTGIAPVSVDDSYPDSIPIDIGYDLEKIQHLDSEFCALHAPDGSPVLCITEGYATGYAVHMATGCDTIAVRSANNIDPALQAILKNKKYEQYSIIICADNDIRSPSDKNQENTGVVKAKKASEVYGTYLAISPAIQNKKSDFDDVFRNPSLGPACVRETIKKAIAKGASPKIPACFEYDRATGVLKKIYTRGEEQVRKEVICKGLFIRGFARDKASMGWGKVVELLDPCGMKHSLFISHGDLAAGQSALFDKLCHNGLQLATTSSATKQAFCDFVTAYETKCFLRLATRPGWMDNMYVARDKVIGYDGTGEEPYLLSASPMLSQKAGDWEACKRMLHLIAPNPVVGFCLCHFLAGHLLSPLRKEGSGILIIGDSSSGKSTLLRALASLKGNPQEIIYSGRTTDNACEALFAQNNDSCLLIDEIGQMGPYVLPHVAYMMSNGVAKARMSRDQRLREPARWQCTTLMTGEKSLEDILSEANIQPMAGQQVRLVSIDVMEDKERGIFSHLPSNMANTTELVNEVNRLSSENYGFVETMFVQFLIKKLKEDPTFLDTCRQRAAQLASQLKPAASGNQLKRIISHFSVDVLAGELAKEAGILPDDFDPLGSILHCLGKVVEQRGSTEDLESTQIVDGFMNMLARHGSSRFEPITGKSSVEPAVRDRIGFYERDKDYMIYYITSKTLQAELPGNFSKSKIQRALVAAGILATFKVLDKGRETISHTTVKKLPDAGYTRVYVLRVAYTETYEDKLDSILNRPIYNEPAAYEEVDNMPPCDEELDDDLGPIKPGFNL